MSNHCWVWLSCLKKKPKNKNKKNTTEFLEVLKNQSGWFSGMEIETGRRKQSEIHNVYATPSLYNNIFLVMSGSCSTVVSEFTTLQHIRVPDNYI